MTPMSPRWQAAGVAVTVLPALETFPDSMFVEDPALTFTEGAILLRPGAPSRAGETAEIAPTLRDMFETVIELSPPGFADGGDVLVTPKSVMIGLSSRTNRAGAEALVTCLAKLGHKGTDRRDARRTCCISRPHARCSMTKPSSAPRTWPQSGMFDGFGQVITPDGEEAAANALRVNDVVLVGSDFPRTIEMLDRLGYAGRSSPNFGNRQDRRRSVVHVAALVRGLGARQAQREPRAFAGRAVEGDVAAHRAGQASGDGEAEAGAVGLFADPFEAFEDALSGRPARHLPPGRRR